MADGINRVVLLGNLGEDAELRSTQSGEPVANMRLATNESYKDRDGERREKTEWHNLVLWGKRADALADYLTKGKQIFVEGRLQTNSWEDKDGNKRYKTEIRVSNIVLLGGGEERRDNGRRRDRDDDRDDRRRDDRRRDRDRGRDRDSDRGYDRDRRDRRDRDRGGDFA